MKYDVSLTKNQFLNHGEFSHQIPNTIFTSTSFNIHEQLFCDTYELYQTIHHYGEILSITDIHNTTLSIILIYHESKVYQCILSKGVVLIINEVKKV